MGDAQPDSKPIARFHCPVCGIKAWVPADTPRIVCACDYVQLGGVTPGLGDLVSAGLHWMGITEERYQAAKEKVGFKRKCNCRKRQEKLNALGKWLGIG